MYAAQKRSHCDAPGEVRSSPSEAMTAPVSNPPLTTPLAGASAMTGGGQGAATGFEALLAAFFGAQGQGAQAALTSGALSTAGDDTPAAEPMSSDQDGDQTQAAPGISPDAAALAAMLIVPQQPAQPAPSQSPPAAEGQAKSAPAQPFAAPVPQAPATDLVAAQAVDAAASDAAETAELPLAAGEQAAAEPPAVEAKLERKPAPAAEPAAPPRAQAAATPTTTEPQRPPPAAPQGQAQVQAALAEAMQGEAQAESASEPVPTPEPQAAKATRQADARRNSAHAAPVAQASVDSTPATRPVTAAAAAGTAAQTGAEPTAGLEADAAPPSQAKAEPAARGASDALPPGPAAPAVLQAHAAVAHAAPARATSETIANLTAQIGRKLEGRSTRFDVELTPAGLGHVSVSVEIAASGKLTAAMTFDTPQAAAELRARSHELQRALEQAGFYLSGGLSFDVAGQGGRQAQQQQQQNDGAAWRGRAFQAVLGTAGEAAEAAAAAALQYARRPEAGVDIRI